MYSPTTAGEKFSFFLGDSAVPSLELCTVLSDISKAFKVSMVVRSAVAQDCMYLRHRYAERSYNLFYA